MAAWSGPIGSTAPPGDAAPSRRSRTSLNGGLMALSGCSAAIFGRTWPVFKVPRLLKGAGRGRGNPTRIPGFRFPV